MIIKRRKKNKGSRQIIFFPILLGIVILVAVGFLIYSNWQINKQRADLTARLENLKKEVVNLEKQKEELSNKVPQIQKEDYLEKEARERFNLKKPGEEMVVVLPPPSQENKEKTEEKKGFLEEWWQIIKSKF